MGSKGRIPPHMRRPLPGPGTFSPEPFGHGGHLPLGAMPHEVMPSREMIEQKIAAQHNEMRNLATENQRLGATHSALRHESASRDIIEQKLAVQHNEMRNLATENQRLAATHSALRHELAAFQHEFQRLQARMSGARVEHEQQMMSVFDKLAKMEADLKASEPLKVELQQAQAEAQNLAAARQELIIKVQELTQDLQKNHGDAQQIPSLISELDSLRQNYEHCRSTYDYERKLRIDHYESLQVMEKNYVSMLGEVEKLQRELMNATHVDKSGGPYGGNMGYKDNDTTGQQHSAGKNAYEDGYRAPQGIGPAGGGAQFGGAPVRPAPVPARPGYDAARGTAYEAPPRSMGYDASAAPHYEASRGSSYEPPRGPNYDAGRGPGYDAHGNTAAPAQGPTAAPANTAPPYMMSQMSQVPAPYGSAQGPMAYGAPHMQAHYGAGGGYEMPMPPHGAAPTGGAAGANQRHR